MYNRVWCVRVCGVCRCRCRCVPLTLQHVSVVRLVHVEQGRDLLVVVRVHVLVDAVPRQLHLRDVMFEVMGEAHRTAPKIFRVPVG